MPRAVRHGARTTAVRTAHAPLVSDSAHLKWQLPVFAQNRERASMDASRRTFRNVLSKFSYVAAIDLRAGRFEAPTGSLFDLLDDDTVLMLLLCLAEISPDAEGAKWQRARASTARNIYALCTTCTRLWHVLDGIGLLLRVELIGRAATDVFPRVRGCGYPSAAQRLREKASLERIKVLRGCETAMAFHCASKHCSCARRDACSGYNFKIKSIERSRVSLMSSAKSTALCYISLQTLMSNGRIKQVIRLVNSLGTVVAETSDEQTPAPFSMSASPNGARVAYVVTTDELTTDSVGGGIERLCVWDALGTGFITMHGVDMPCEWMANEGSLTLTRHPVAHPLNMWWTDSTTLVVAWSTTFVHPSGMDAENGGYVMPTERYILCTYDVSNPGSLEYIEAVGPFFGRLVSISATDSGDRVVALVRINPLRQHESHYHAVVHYQGQQVPMRHPSIWKGKGKGPGGRDWGPSAVGISPMGDAVVCMHRTLGSVLVEVMDLDRGGEYVSTNSRDITEWFSRNDLTEDDLMKQWHEEDEEDESEYMLNKVKLPYAVGFSDCGSFASIVDRRPIHGSTAPHYSTVLINVSHRRKQRDLKAVPLFRERYSVVKSLEWRACGIWTQARRGLLLLSERS